MRALSVLSADATRLGALILLSLLMLGTALADEGDPPGRVARLSYVQGSVSLQSAGAQDWGEAELNRPLTTNDRLWSDTPGSRAELDMGGAVIRLGSGTDFSFLNLDDNIAQMQVTAGTVIVRVRELLDNQTYEIDTPNLSVLLDQPGQYRVDVSEAGDTTVVRVSDGHAEASDGGQPYQIDNQEMTTFMGSDQVSVIPATLGAPDGFDGWSFQRDREFDQAVSRQYVAEDVAGTQDLDDNGQWQNTPDYGYVWVPTTVAVDWAPYSVGHWAYIAPWGYTWVDAASWGYAPFHYGRWARYRNSWCWVPGPRQVRPVYAPAMVAWVGGGGGAHVGWFPLGPREVFVPGYRVSDRYVHSVNITNTTIVDRTYITNVYRGRDANVHYVNSRVRGGVTTVPQNVFASAQSVNAHRVNFPRGQEGRFATTGVAPSIAPVRQNVMRGGAVRRPPAALANREVVARTAPPAAPGVRVRMVTPPADRERGGFNGRGFNRPGAAGQPSRAGESQQGRPGEASQVRPGQSQQVRPGEAQQVRPGQSQQVRPGEAPQVRSGESQQGRPGESQQGRPGFQQSQPPVQQQSRAPAVMPSPPAAGDNRSWAEREHALEHNSLPPAPAPGQAPAAGPRENGGQGFRPGQVEQQQRAGSNSSGRPAVENRAPVENRSLEQQQRTLEQQRQMEQRGQIEQQRQTEQRQTEQRQTEQRQTEQRQQQQQVEQQRQIEQQRQQGERQQQEQQRQMGRQQEQQRQQLEQRQQIEQRQQMEQRSQERAIQQAPVPHFNAPPPPPAPVPHFNAPPPPPAPVPTPQAAPRPATPPAAPAQRPAPANRSDDRPAPRGQGRQDPR